MMMTTTPVVVVFIITIVSSQFPGGSANRGRSDSMTVASAPRLTRFPDKEVAFRLREDVTLPCLAEADKHITYWWKKDGEVVNMSSRSKYQMRSGEGSMVVRSPTVEDEGIYQCYAKTDFGTAMSINITLKGVALESFPTVTAPVTHRPSVGSALNLTCQPPRSYPAGYIYWGVSTLGAISTKLEPVDNDNRVLLDYDGRLYFSNVVPEDSLTSHGSNLYYACVVNNKNLGKLVKGNEQKVEPVMATPGGPRYQAPQLMWTSSIQDKAIRGQDKRMKCIFSGYPTPRVTWKRLDADMPSRANVTEEGFGTEIEIKKVNFADAGRYECSASNTNDGQAIVSRVITLTVESSPYWRQNKIPTDVDAIEDERVIIECIADGTPRPTIEWFVNGLPIDEMAPDARRKVVGNKIHYESITIATDSLIFQCMAANEHGQILANMALNIQAFAPSFTVTPVDRKEVEGRTFVMQCRAAGAPRPTIGWWMTSTGREVQNGHRYFVNNNGDLEIRNAALSHSDLYECRIANKFGGDVVAVSLIIRRPTVITKHPKNQIVNVTNDVTLPCEVTTDPAERENLRVVWRKNGKPIDYPSRDGRFQINVIDYSLTIRTTEIKDTAIYTCHAENGVDEVESEEAHVIVKGAPEPPTDVKVTSCSVSLAGVTWRPGLDNNDPIIEYVVFCRRSDDPIGNITECFRIFQPESNADHSAVPELRAAVKVHPWANFTFLVVARNSIGTSRPSSASNVCATPPMRPSRNPAGVCTRMGSPKQLIIVWEPLPRSELNGNGFQYRVGYRQLGSDHPQEEKVIRDPLQSELVIHDQEIFKKYEIYVQSANDLGEASLSNFEKRMGYSGEGKPTVIPKNLRYNATSLNSTFVQMFWDPVDVSEDRVNGFFRGYRIEFWRVEKPEEKRTQDIGQGLPFNPCPPFTPSNSANRGRAARDIHSVRGSTNNLWPDAKIRAGVLVLNQANYGRLSDTVEFQTPEGVPGLVASLEVVEAGSHHLKVEWTPPLERNGVITLYVLTYQIAPPHDGKPKEQRLSDLSRLSAKIFELASSTSYSISLLAVTKAGRGSPVVTIGKTRPEGDPSKPEIGNVDVADTSANVSWIPTSVNDQPGNPGSSFYVQYREKDNPDDQEWKETAPVADDNNWANVTGLKPGRTYEVRIVAVNGLDDENERETKSDIWTVYIPSEGERTTRFWIEDKEKLMMKKGESHVWWFIILMCIIILLLIILFIICLIYRTRGQVYPVYEKEKLWGSPHKNDDQPFGEYAREDAPFKSADQLRKSKESLLENDDQKPIDSDSDSLGDYDDPDPGKFNEDGSFIGAYNTKTRPPGEKSAKRKSSNDDSRAVNTYV